MWIGIVPVCILVVYAFAGHNSETKGVLLSYVLQRASIAGPNVIVAGDFNESLYGTPALSTFREKGFVNAMEWAKFAWPDNISPTYNGKTYNDTCLMRGQITSWGPYQGRLNKLRQAMEWPITNLQLPPGDRRVFYTDGSCTVSAGRLERHAAWAIVVDKCHLSESQVHFMQEWHKNGATQQLSSMPEWTCARQTNHKPS